jgi:hypothetical protein
MVVDIGLDPDAELALLHKQNLVPLVTYLPMSTFRQVITVMQPQKQSGDHVHFLTKA